VALTLYLRVALRGPATVHIGGAVAAAYDYPKQHGDIAPTTAEGTLREVTGHYNGVPVQELLARAQPQTGVSLLLVRGSDGYAFFISMDEVRDNSGLLLSSQGEGDDAAYDLVGAKNSKAWVRGVSELVVVSSATLEMSGALDKPALYDPDDWQFEMDSTRLDVGDGAHKYQGVPLGLVLRALEPQDGAMTVVVHTDGEPVSRPLAEVLGDDDLRLFTIIGESDVTFALARMDGQVLAARVTSIEVR
jgi:DMSO/TMAO reductase YedYZ molybdopterin-dependent catalytic subunit